MTDMKYRAWVSWHGGERPVSPDTWVEVYPRQGLDLIGKASRFDWSSTNILRYRLCAPDEYHDPKPPPLDEGWIKHTGLTCPVPPGTKVRVRFRNGTVSRLPYEADGWSWTVSMGDHDIDAYQIVDQPKPTSPNDHYRQGEIECIDAIRAALTDEEWRGYCKGNVLKYTWREKHKGGDGSLLKAQDYLRWALAGKAEDKR
jgi:hypothetical protein